MKKVTGAKRVVLLGHPLVGKTSTLQAIGRRKGGAFESLEMRTSDPISDRGLKVSWQEGPDSFEVVTLSGSVWDSKSWSHLSAPGCQYVLLIDVQASAQTLTLFEVISALQNGRGPLGAVQFTKMDLVEKVPAIDLPFLERMLRNIGVPCFFSRLDQPETLCAGCFHVLDRTKGK